MFTFHHKALSGLIAYSTLDDHMGGYIGFVSMGAGFMEFARIFRESFVLYSLLSHYFIIPKMFL